MSKFYGTVKGNRGASTRCGSLSSGIRASAQSWKGSVVVHMYERDADGELMVQISAPEGSTSGMCFGTTSWNGTFGDFQRLLSA